MINLRHIKHIEQKQYNKNARMEPSNPININLLGIVIRLDLEYLPIPDPELIVHTNIKPQHPHIKYPNCYPTPGRKIAGEVGLVGD